MANPGEHEGLTPNVDQGTGMPDMMPRDPDEPRDLRNQPSTAGGAFGAATGSDYGSGTDSDASSATGSTGAGLGDRGGAGWGGSGGGASPSVGALSGSNARGVGDGAVGSDTNTDATGGTLGAFGGTDRASDTATESFSGPTAPEPEQPTLPQRPTHSSQVDAADQNQYGGDISQVAPEERQNTDQKANQDTGQNMGQGMTGDQGITPDTRQGGI